MEIWTHRGRLSPDRPGNSLNDFISSYNAGATGIETDICFTADKKVIIYHPGTQTPDLAQMRWKDILASNKNTLTLNDTLLTLKSFTRLQCSLDIKQYSTELVREAVRAITVYRLEDRVYLTAFQIKMPLFPMETNAELLAFAKAMNPKIRTHIMAVFPFNLPALHRKYSPDAISFGWLQDPLWLKIVSENLFKATVTLANLKDQVSYLRTRGVKVWGGIVNEPRDMEYLAELGVSGLVTDNLPIGKKFISEWEDRKQ